MPILTLQQMQERLAQMTYRPGWKMRIYEGHTEGPMFELKANVDDSVVKGNMAPLEIYSPIPPQVSYESFYLWVFWRLRRIEVHECGEFLQLDGSPIFFPHRELADRDLLPV